MNQKKLSTHQSLLSIGLLSLLISILSTACSASKPTTSQAPTQATNTVANSTANASTVSEIDPADACILNDCDASLSPQALTDETTVSEIDPADACILNDCAALPAPRALTTDELNTIATEISSKVGPDETLIHNQSFALTLPIIGRADLIATKSQNNKLFLRLRPAPNQYELIYQSQQWNLWDVKAVALEDIHQNGDGPDIIVIADYVTGIGPTGAQPFSIAHILFNRGDDSFQTDIAVDRILEERNANTINSVIEIAQTENLVRGLQYREGPP